MYQSVPVPDMKPASPTPDLTWIIVIAVVVPAALALAVGILWRWRHLARVNNTIDIFDAEEAL